MTVKGLPLDQSCLDMGFPCELPGCDEVSASSLSSEASLVTLLVFPVCPNPGASRPAEIVSDLPSASVPAIWHPHAEPLPGRVGAGCRGEVVLGQPQTCLPDLLLPVP